MSRLTDKRQAIVLRKGRIRSRVKGSNDRARMSVKISNRHISAQIIDDAKGFTLASVNTSEGSNLKGNMTAKAVWVGTEIAKKAKTAKIKKVILDRNGKLYHGRIKALAEAARKEGLEF